MKIKNKITLVLLISLLFLTLILTIYLRIRINQNKVYFENFKLQQEKVVNTAISTKSNIAKTLVFDYTYWDEVVDYVHQKKDKVWENNILGTVIPSYKINAVWVLNTKRTCLFHKNNIHDSSEVILNLENEIYEKLFTNHFIHFFINTQKGIIEIHGATIHPSNDIQRNMEPQGYFFIGQYYDSVYLNELSLLTDSKVIISQTDSNIESKDYTDIRTIIPLKDGFNNNISELTFIKKYNNLENFIKISRIYLIFLIFSIILTLFFFYISFNIWVNKPIQEIMKSLSNNETKNLAKLLKKKNEFAKIAEILINFMNQKQILQDEINKRELAEQAFTDKEKLYKRLFNNKLIGIVFSKDQKIVDANAAFLNFVSFLNIKEIKSLKIIDLFTDNSKAILLELLSNNKNENNIELEIISSKNTIRDVLVNFQNVEIDNNVYQLFFFNDISKIKKIENDLIYEKQYFQHLYNESPDAILISDNEGIIIKINNSFTKLFGYTELETYGKKTIDLISNETNKAEILNLIKRINKGETISFESKRITKERKEIDVQIICTPIELNKENTGIYEIYRDISDKKKYNEELKSKGLLFKSIANILSNLWKIENESNSINYFLKSLANITNSDRVYIFRNYKDIDEVNMKLIYEWTNSSNISVIDNPLFANIPYKPDYTEWYSTLNKKRDILIQYNNTSKSNKINFLNQSINSIILLPLEINSTFWGFIGLDNCVTEHYWNDTEISIIHIASNNLSSYFERKLSADELIKAKKVAEESDKLKSNFIANMSHELRTPLNGMLGFTELLDEELTDKSHKEMLDIIQKSGLRLMDTLNSILDLTMIEANVIVLNKFVFEINSLIYEKIELYKKNALIKNLFIHFDTESNYQIFTDFKLLSRIISNILDNAVKYTKKGGIKIKLETETKQNENYLIIKIKDTGIGIEEKHYHFIFNHFTQVSNGLSREYEGSGIGLSICKKYIDLLNGSIEVESKINEGSLFTIKIPGLITTQKQIESKNIINTNEKAKILLVEDEISNREYTFYVLSKEFNVDIAENGKDAINLTRTNNYDAILMDINLGRGLNGVETVAEIRKNASYNSTPIAAVTANAFQSQEEEFLNNGMTHYIAKPYNKNDIINFVYKMLKHK